MRVTWSDLLLPGDAGSFFVRDPLPVPDVDAREYSAANAWWLAELSRIAYRRDALETPTPPQPLRAEFLRRAGLEEVELFRSAMTGTAALLVRAVRPTPFAALVFRGTEQELQDFLHDADTVPVSAFGGTVRVHRGFKRALNSVWTPIANALDRLDCPVFYAGHSLGAALATLAALRRPPRAVYAFGSPRVGDEQFVAKLRDVPVYRIVHGNDIVTTVPPEIFGFRHAGEERRIGSSTPGALSFDPAVLWNQLITPIGLLADHAPINYVERV
ncbi:MAG TPA: lipase family protein [Povalibacter sp.]|nr:lipase family protein [Povalibacter sp.]